MGLSLVYEKGVKCGAVPFYPMIVAHPISTSCVASRLRVGYLSAFSGVEVHDYDMLLPTNISKQFFTSWMGNLIMLIALGLSYNQLQGVHIRDATFPFPPNTYNISVCASCQIFLQFLAIA